MSEALPKRSSLFEVVKPNALIRLNYWPAMIFPCRQATLCKSGNWLKRVAPMIEPTPLQQLDRTYVRFRGRKFSYFSGCDYFRLASHPKVVAALQDGVKKYGLNVAASRLTTGNHILYRRLEQSLVKFFHAPSALLVPTGYMSNLVVAQALAGNFSHALIDAESHPSLSDAARCLDCPVLRFEHQNAEALARSVRRCGAGARLILFTEGLFSRDGSVA